MALATAIMVALATLVAVGSIGWAVRDRAARAEQLAQERTSRQAKISGQLELILDEVARLEQKEKWSEALVSARRAEPVLTAGEAPPDMQQRVRLTLANLELVRQLDEIRAQSGTVWGSPEPFRMRLASQADHDYAAAFRNADINIDALSLDEAANQLSTRREVSAAVLPVLDDWVAVRSKIGDQAATEKLVAVLRTADPDPWRQRLRDALVRKDWRALENLAKSPDLDRQPAATITFLCAALREQAESDIDTPGKIAGELGPRGFLMEIDILRRAQRNFPSDFWINHRLGITLIGLETPDLVVAEGIGYMRAAVALRPESSHAIMNLGNGYAELGNQDEAIACYRRAIEIAPGNWVCYTNLGHALRRKSAYKEAIASYEQSIKLNPDGGASAQAALAMLLSNCPVAELRNRPRAIELANRATQLEPNAGDYWTALGVARYRDGQWQTACTALDRSLELGTGGKGGGNLREKEAIDLFFLAMSHWQMSQHDQARQCYDRAAESMGQQLTHDEQLLRFQTEAKELLQITDENPTTTQDKN
jgi:tetratricopeptide (TPR) repeat protein